MSENRKSLEQLQREHEEREDAKVAIGAITKYANRAGHNKKALVDRLDSEHRTLQHEVVAFIAGYLWRLAHNYDEGYYDARNQFACEWAHSIREAGLLDRWMPFNE